MASLHDATSPCDLLQGLVARTSPIVCADLKNLLAPFSGGSKGGARGATTSPLILGKKEERTERRKANGASIS